MKRSAICATTRYASAAPNWPVTAAWRLTLSDAAMLVERLPGRAAFPRRRGPARLFTLAPRQVGRYRANFRFTGCACSPRWFYEDWVVHGSNGQVEPEQFIHGAPDRDIDDRVHLYSGTTRLGG